MFKTFNVYPKKYHRIYLIWSECASADTYNTVFKIQTDIRSQKNHENSPSQNH